MERGGAWVGGGGGDRVGLGVLGYLRHDIIVEGLLPVSYARRSCDGDESRLLDGPDAKDAVVPPHVDAARRQDGELHLVFKSSQKEKGEIYMVRYILAQWHVRPTKTSMGWAREDVPRPPWPPRARGGLGSPVRWVCSQTRRPNGTRPCCPRRSAAMRRPRCGSSRRTRSPCSRRRRAPSGPCRRYASSRTRPGGSQRQQGQAAWGIQCGIQCGIQVWNSVGESIENPHPVPSRKPLGDL